MRRHPPLSPALATSLREHPVRIRLGELAAHVYHGNVPVVGHGTERSEEPLRGPRLVVWRSPPCAPALRPRTPRSRAGVPAPACPDLVTPARQWRGPRGGMPACAWRVANQAPGTHCLPARAGAEKVPEARVLEVLKDNNMNSNLAFDILEDELRRASRPLPRSALPCRNRQF